MRRRFFHHWRRLLTRYNGPRGFGRLAARLAAWDTHPLHARAALARIHPRGFVDAGAYVRQHEVTLGQHIFIGGGVTFLVGNREGGRLILHDRAQLYGDTFLQAGSGAAIEFHEDAHIQPGCHFRAFIGDIRIGRKAEVASGCSFYSSTHGVEPSTAIMDQPLSSRGPIVVGDGAWLGHGVTVLEGVSIGEGAVVGAHAVVNRDIPPMAIAVGVPAKVVRYRDGRS